MSLEFLVLLALFTLLPIIEQAWRKHREARQRAERHARGLPPVPPPLPHPPPIPRMPPGHAPFPTDADDLDWDDDADVAVVVPPVPRPKPVPVPIQVVPSPVVPRPVVMRRVVEPPARRQTRRLRSLLRDRNAVRHGIVLMTVLSPCRANAPYDVPAGDR